jgi:hypothetical protein
MGKTLLSEVWIEVESDTESATGALLQEINRAGRLQKDLKALGPDVQDAIGGTRETTIHGLFFGGVLGRLFREAAEVSGIFAALISLALGLTGSVLDTVFIAMLDGLRDLKQSIGEFEWDKLWSGEYIYRGSHEEGVKGIAFQTLEDLLFPILGPEPPEYSIPEDGETVNRNYLDTNIDIEHATRRIKEMRNTLKDDPRLGKLYDSLEGIKQMEKWLVKNPASTMADFWVDAITKTRGWKRLTGTGGT